MNLILQEPSHQLLLVKLILLLLVVEDLGVLNGPPSWGTGGGAGGVILRKFVDVTAGTAYTMTVAGVNGITTAFYDGGAITAHNGAQGSVGNSSPVPGGISTAASGSGGGGWNVSAGGTGVNIVGQGMPGFASPPAAGAGSSTGGGGGAGAGGPTTFSKVQEEMEFLLDTLPEILHR